MTDCSGPKVNDFPANTSLKRKIRVGPWRNKEEFEMVYNWIYGIDADILSKAKAFKRLTVWKLRRCDLTPATILSTAVILEMQLRDDLNSCEKESNSDLRVMYSSAFTRFLNYMSSIMQTRNMKTMYETAKELGLESFIVDLRHLCAHGQNMPSLEIFRKTGDYCMKWLKEFYWDQEIANMSNVDARHIRQKERTAFDETVTELFQVLDNAVAAIFKNCLSVAEAKKKMPSESYGVLKKYSNIINEQSLTGISRLIVKDLSAQVKREPGMKDVQSIYIQALFKSRFFFEVAANSSKTNKEKRAIIQMYQHLFQEMAFYGFIEGLFHRLIDICENNYEASYRRKGASFWANEIAIGFVVFRNFKIKYKEAREQNPDLNWDLSSLNRPNMAVSLKKLYRDMGVDIGSTLIFGDNFRQPWSLYFSRSYIEERIRNINDLSAEVIANCLLLVVPALSESEIADLKNLINIYVGCAADNCESVAERDGNAKIYTLKEDVLPKSAVEEDDCASQDDEKDYGIWSIVSGSDWSTCPLGRLPDEIF